MQLTAPRSLDFTEVSQNWHSRCIAVPHHGHAAWHAVYLHVLLVCILSGAAHAGISSVGVSPC
jgi:hypothetical protein